MGELGRTTRLLDSHLTTSNGRRGAKAGRLQAGTQFGATGMASRSSLEQEGKPLPERRTTGRASTAGSIATGRASTAGSIATGRASTGGRSPRPKEVHKLWTWYRLHDMQQVTHIGEEETDDCWKKLQGLKRKKQLENDPEL